MSWKSPGRAPESGQRPDEGRQPTSLVGVCAQMSAEAAPSETAVGCAACRRGQLRSCSRKGVTPGVYADIRAAPCPPQRGRSAAKMRASESTEKLAHVVPGAVRQRRARRAPSRAQPTLVRRESTQGNAAGPEKRRHTCGAVLPSSRTAAEALF